MTTDTLPPSANHPTYRAAYLQHQQALETLWRYTAELWEARRAIAAPENLGVPITPAQVAEINELVNYQGWAYQAALTTAPRWAVDHTIYLATGRNHHA
ncbi:hypothetical protein C1Y63_10425 [Corynebacterium sp. 13CS0277]|uniref:hypothetical protein n=1 Tax=Corynebacterium sp. 13CS0277 TaxID=2071994 RepID=UPI000D043176|nr:hypothetical protein [Corynebacterium sp. 13CS0277]PRQ10602.1 hypothetical protein C1Y63_10425 [Corynebacterium sp. 13CS0277]